MFHAKWSPAVEEYFRSIEHPFEETQRALRREGRTGFFKGVFIFAFVFSLIPVVPYVLCVVTPKYFGVRFFPLLRHQIPLGSFWFWWPTAFAISLVLLILSFKVGGPTDESRAKRLSPVQMRFAYCYALLEEIKQYRRNHLQQHIEKASEYLTELDRGMMRLRFLAYAPSHPHAAPEDFEYITYLERQDLQMGPTAYEALGRRFAELPRWFKLDPQTQRSIEAINAFWGRVNARLKDKKDLPSLLDALSDLALYLYSEIPDTGAESTDERKDLEAIGDAALNSFSQTVLELAPYQGEPKPETAKEGASRWIVTAGRKVSYLFVHQNAIVCFGAWYLLSLILIVAAVKIAFRLHPELKMDTVILSTIVGIPVAGATAAVTIPRLRRHEAPRPNPPAK